MSRPNIIVVSLQRMPGWYGLYEQTADNERAAEPFKEFFCKSNNPRNQFATDGELYDVLFHSREIDVKWLKYGFIIFPGGMRNAI